MQNAVCVRCGELGKYRCSRCGKVSYCSAICQKEHWERGHKGQCKLLAEMSKSGSSIVLSSSGETDNQPVISVPNVPAEKWLCKPERVAQLAEWEPTPQMFEFSSVGIENVGNTCFLNCVLQCLAYSPPLSLYLQSKEHRQKCPLRTQDVFCAVCAMEDWVSLLLNTTSDYFVRPVAIVRNLKLLSDRFRLGQQDDAHEFLYALVQSMQRSLIMASENPVAPAEEDTSVLHQLFGGFKCHQMQCSKCHVATPVKNFEYFLTLTLPLQGKRSVEEVMFEFLRDHMVEGWKCPSCGGLDGVERSCFYKTHPLLVLHLMRFDERANKINSPVTFREEISLRTFVHPDVVDEADTEYDLYGVVVHYGNSLMVGHFVSFVKVHGRWYLCDDLKITEVSPSVVMSQMAYLLFYRKRNVVAKKGSSGKKNPQQVEAPKPSVVPKPTLQVEEAKPKSPAALKTSDFGVFYRLEGDQMVDFVVLIKCNSDIKSADIAVEVQSTGTVFINCGSSVGALKFTIPFPLAGNKTLCKWYVNQRVVALIIPMGDGSEAPPHRMNASEVVSQKVEEVVDESCVLDVTNELADVTTTTTTTTTSSSSSTAATASTASSATQVVYDWNQEASYKNLYDEIRKKQVTAQPKRPAATATATKQALPKRNDKCFCGSGKKFKNCHDKR